MADNDTPTPATPAIPVGTPADQAVEKSIAAPETASVADVLGKLAQEATTPTPPSDTSKEPAPIVKRYADKYDSDIALEQGYKDLQAEYTRTAQEAARLRSLVDTQVQAPRPLVAPPEPNEAVRRYSSEQLETYKEGHLVNLSRFQVNGEPEKASEAAAAIRIIDAELRRRDREGVTQQYEQRGATERLRQEVIPILSPYRTELSPGNPVFDTANDLYLQSVQAGEAANEVTAAKAALIALAKHGKFTSGAEQKARQDVTKNIQDNLKAGVVAGAGAAAAPTGGLPDFTKMTDKEFTEWKVRNLGSQWA